MKRREFITLVGGGAAAWPLTARAQRPTMPLVGYLSANTASGDARPILAFLKGLGETGYEDGKTVKIVYRWADGQYDRLPSMAADLVRDQVAVIAALGTPAVRAAKAATTSVPKIRRQHIGFVFQSYHLFSTLTVAENVRLALDVRGERGLRAVTKTEEILASVGLTSKLASFPRQLSGGEQQRVAIARAIVAEPSAILADEPTAALDAANGQATMAILSAIAKERGRAVLVVTHDPRLFGFADRIIYIEDGTLSREQSADLSPADTEQP